MTRKNTVATVATIIVALLALGAAFFLLYKMSEDQARENDYVYVPSAQINAEMNDNAIRLVKNNCEIFRVFLQYGLSYEPEPYNNLPEDGFYSVKSDKYASMADLEKLVKTTFVEKEANRILENANGNGAVFSEETREDGSTGIGLSMNMVDNNGHFKGIAYDYSWTNPKVLLRPVSNTECDIEIELERENKDNDGNPAKLTATMIKANGNWYLQKLTY